MNSLNLAEYHCEHCGREFIIDEIGDIKHCPYCGDMDIARYSLLMITID